MEMSVRSGDAGCSLKLLRVSKSIFYSGIVELIRILKYKLIIEWGDIHRLDTTNGTEWNNRNGTVQCMHSCY